MSGVEEQEQETFRYSTDIPLCMGERMFMGLTVYVIAITIYAIVHILWNAVLYFLLNIDVFLISSRIACICGLSIGGVFFLYILLDSFRKDKESVFAVAKEFYMEMLHGAVRGYEK